MPKRFRPFSRNRGLPASTESGRDIVPLLPVFHLSIFSMLSVVPVVRQANRLGFHIWYGTFGATCTGVGVSDLAQSAGAVQISIRTALLAASYDNNGALSTPR